jgi:hypothetical protein
MQCEITTIGNLSQADRQLMLTALTRQGSEMQDELSSYSTSSTPIALVRSTSGTICAWAASHRWRGFCTLEGWTAMGQRGQGIGTWAAAGLIARGVLVKHTPVAVFAPACVVLATHLRLKPVLFLFDGSDWVKA